MRTLVHGPGERGVPSRFNSTRSTSRSGRTRWPVQDRSRPCILTSSTSQRGPSAHRYSDMLYMDDDVQLCMRPSSVDTVLMQLDRSLHCVDATRSSCSGGSGRGTGGVRGEGAEGGGRAGHQECHPHLQRPERNPLPESTFTHSTVDTCILHSTCTMAKSCRRTHRRRRCNDNSLREFVGAGRKARTWSRIFSTS